MTTLVLLAAVGLAAQLVDGSLGMAYGVTSTSLLLAHGLSPAVASASVHMAEVGTSFVSGVAHWRVGNVDRRVVLRIGVPGALGAFAGATMLSKVSLSAATPITSSLLLGLGIYVIARFAGNRPRRISGRPYVRGRHLALLGGVAGFVDASGGGGWGPIATPTLLATGKMEPRTVIGSVSAAEFAVAVAASLGFGAALGVSGISWLVVVGLLAGGSVAAPLAAHLVKRVVPELLGAAVGGLIVLTNLRTLLLHAGVDHTSIVLAAGVVAWVAWLWTVRRRIRRRNAAADRAMAV